MNQTSSSKNKVIFTGFLILGTLALSTVIWKNFRRPIQRVFSRIKMDQKNGLKMLKQEDIFFLISEIRKECLPIVKQTIKKYKTERRKLKGNQKQYEKCVKKMEKEIEKIAFEKSNLLFEKYVISSVIFTRSVEFYKSEVLLKAFDDMLRIQNKEVKLDSDTKDKIVSHLKRIQEGILDSTDVNNFSEIMFHQIVDVIWEKFGIEFDEIDWGYEQGFDLESDFRIKFEQSFKAESMLKNISLNDSLN